PGIWLPGIWLPGFIAGRAEQALGVVRDAATAQGVAARVSGALEQEQDGVLAGVGPWGGGEFAAERLGEPGLIAGDVVELGQLLGRRGEGSLEEALLGAEVAFDEGEVHARVGRD